MLRKKYKLFQKWCKIENVPAGYNQMAMYVETLKFRILYGIHFEEYLRNRYYDPNVPERKLFDYLLALKNNHNGRIRSFIDLLLCRLVFGIRIDEYFRNEFYTLKWCARKGYLTTGVKQKMMHSCNSSKYIPEVDDKDRFNVNFVDFIKREWIDLETCTEESFVSFCQRHPRSFYKFSDGLQGIGTRVVDFSKESAEEFYASNKGSRAILEELVIQHPAMAEFNPSTVNTLRVITFVCADNTVKVVRAAMRTGRAGQVADNFHHHGIAANIDVETGIVMSIGVDAEYNEYLQHPDSGKTFPGFVIPHWDKVLEGVCNAAKVVPEVRYIGWDVAIRENDICLIEGNSTACPDVVEMPIRRGAWKDLKPLVEEVRALSK